MDKSQKIRARWIVPIAKAPIENGFVEIVDGRIVDVGKFCGQSDCRDLGDVAVLPGLVNAHTHLEFSDLTKPIGEQGTAITDWIPQVVANRKSKALQGELDFEVAISRGLQECYQVGTAYVGEIATQKNLTHLYGQSQVAGTIFLECLGAAPERTAEIVEQATEFVTSPDGFGDDQRHWILGLSPHAPYSVHPKLLDETVDISRRHQTTVAMHIAESREEIAWIENRTGPFREMLTSMGACYPDEIPNDYSVQRVLETLTRAHRCLVVHGNYLTDENIELLARHRQKMSVVYCPRTHQFFGHENYPLQKLLQAGINVALGTDSRASNPDLHLCAEGCAVVEQNSVDIETALRMITLNGAVGLGVDRDYGSIEVGKIAVFSILKSSERKYSLEDFLFSRSASSLRF